MASLARQARGRTASRAVRTKKKQQNDAVSSVSRSRSRSLLSLCVPDYSGGEGSAQFVLSKQKLSSWANFTAILGSVLVILNVAWIDNSTGFGKPFVDAVSQLSDSPEAAAAEPQKFRPLLRKSWIRYCLELWYESSSTTRRKRGRAKDDESPRHRGQREARADNNDNL